MYQPQRPEEEKSFPNYKKSFVPYEFWNNAYDKMLILFINPQFELSGVCVGCHRSL